MKRFIPILALAAVSISSAASAQYVNDKYVGRLTSAGTSVNSSTVAALNTNGATGAGASGLMPGAYTIQCKDGAAYFETQTTTTGSTTATTGTLIQAGQPWPFGVPATGDGATAVYFAIISVSGTANCDVWRSRG